MSLKTLSLSEINQLDNARFIHELGAIFEHSPWVAHRVGELTQDSTNEQSGAGLNACSPKEYETLTRLNTAYNEKFGFPFILAVTGHNRASIIENFTSRLGNTQAVEFEMCLQQIYRIAEIRLRALIRDSLL